MTETKTYTVTIVCNKTGRAYKVHVESTDGGLAMRKAQDKYNAVAIRVSPTIK